MKMRDRKRLPQRASRGPKNPAASCSLRADPRVVVESNEDELAVIFARPALVPGLLPLGIYSAARTYPEEWRLDSARDEMRRLINCLNGRGGGEDRRDKGGRRRRRRRRRLGSRRLRVTVRKTWKLESRASPLRSDELGWTYLSISLFIYVLLRTWYTQRLPLNGSRLGIIDISRCGITARSLRVPCPFSSLFPRQEETITSLHRACTLRALFVASYLSVRKFLWGSSIVRRIQKVFEFVFVKVV